MVVYIIAAIFLLCLLAYFYLKPALNQGGYFIASQSQTNERIRNLSLDTPSENASYILDTSKLSFSEITETKEKVEYKADPDRECVI